VPAVSGAFLSVDRPWFEKLGGFSEDYVFGDYEDADLCLKSLLAGSPAWLHDNGMWHLEGRGAQPVPEQEGGALVNRWHFARTWTSTVVPHLLGPTPQHRILRASPDTPADQANLPDTLQGGVAPTGRAKPAAATKPAQAKQRGTQSNGGASAQRAKQRGLKPVPAGAPLPASSRRPR
jgi:hypothetical protein